MQLDLDIYIEDSCSMCDEARRLADLVEQQLPGIRVSVIDVSSAHSRVPAQIFAVPTFVLNGVTFSLGNPDESLLMEKLKSAINNERLDHERD